MPEATQLRRVPEGVRMIRTPEALAQALRDMQTNMLALQVQVDGPDPFVDTLRTLEVSTQTANFCIDVPAVGDLTPLLPLLQDKRRLKVFHHGKRTLRFLAEHLRYDRALGTLCPTLFDTYIASQLLSTGEHEHDLSSLIRRHLPRALQSLLLSSSDYPSLETSTNASITSAAALLPLRTVMRRALVERGLVRVAKLEFDLVPVVADMERAGIYLNLDAWEATWGPIRAERDRLAEAVRRSLGAHMELSLFGTAVFNPDSQQQTLEALRRLGLDLPHTGESLLKRYAHRYPEVRELLAYRTAAKLCSSAGDLFPQYVHSRTGRIHATYEQIGARTGRMSCSDPNVQQVPRHKEIRSCFQAEPGHTLVTADYSQIELRVAAALSQDSRMLQAYRANEDLHRLTASLITQTPLHRVDSAARQAAKAVNFGLLYAMGARGLAKYAESQYGVSLSLEEAQAFRSRYFEAYTGLRRWHEWAKRQLAQAEHKPVEVRSIAGRRYRFTAESGLAAFLNAPVQGSAADIMKGAMVRVHHALAAVPGARIIGVVHDELLVEAPLEASDQVTAIVRDQMERAASEFFSSVPFVADARAVSSWGQA